VYSQVSIVFDESIMGIWYIQLAESFDMMCALARVEGGGYKVNGRTRVYESEDPWDERDRKRWFSGPVEADSDEAAILKARQHVKDITADFLSHFPPDFIPQLFELIRGKRSVEEFANVLRSMPWAHSMEATTH
jgi:hypothetical protein